MRTYPVPNRSRADEDRMQGVKMLYLGCNNGPLGIRRWIQGKVNGEENPWAFRFAEDEYYGY